MTKDDLEQDIAGKTGIDKITKENSLIIKEDLNLIFRYLSLKELNHCPIRIIVK